MIAGIAKEIKSRQNETSYPLNSIYFGGGTPSLLTNKELSFLLKTIKNNYDLGNNVEITLEANPEDISLQTLSQWQKLGINRLSIGLQSFKPSDLNWMNRGHTIKQTIECIELASVVGFKNVSIDLMYGLPGLKIKEWEAHLNRIISSNITHISAYCLTVEKGTKLEREVKKGKQIMPEDDVIEQQYKHLVFALKRAGFEQYEVSNFARHKKYSKHNSAYWKGFNYIGVGPSAHSFQTGYRRWNISNNKIYIKRLAENSCFHEEEFLCQKNIWNELFLTGFRTKWGVSKKHVELLGGFSTKEQARLNDYISAGKIKTVGGSLRLVGDAFIFADGIAQDFFRTL